MRGFGAGLVVSMAAASPHSVLPASWARCVRYEARRRVAFAKRGLADPGAGGGGGKKAKKKAAKRATELVPPDACAIGSMVALTALNVSHNLLRHLPSNLGKLTRLTELHASHNQLGSVPDEITALTRLTTLDLSHNVIGPGLPGGWNGMKRLEEFNVSFNALEKVRWGVLVVLTLEVTYSHTTVPSSPGSVFEGVDTTPAIGRVTQPIGEETEALRAYVPNASAAVCACVAHVRSPS